MNNALLWKVAFWCGVGLALHFGFALVVELLK